MHDFDYYECDTFARDSRDFVVNFAPSAHQVVSNVKMSGSGRLELVMLTLDSKKFCIA